ncbi:MAG: L-lactate permease [Inquilinaceae bacterium]
MLPALALTPIALILALMVGARWSAARAGLAGLALTLVVALAAFGYGEGAPRTAVAGALLEAGFIALTILWIIFPALCIHEMQTAGGRLRLLQDAIERLSPDPRIKAILIGWFLALFFEGAAGFGTPIALTAPILVGIGFKPVQALSIALIGHAAGVSFGAVGTPVLPQIAATGLSGQAIAAGTATLHAVLGGVMLVLMVRLAADGDDTPRPSRIGAWIAFAAVAFLVPFWLLARFVGPELPTLGGALIGALLFAAVVRFRRSGTVDTSHAGPATSRALVVAGMPYLVLLGLILITRLIGPLKATLEDLALSWTLFGVFEGRFAPLYHPGTMLLAGFVVGGLIQGAGRRDLAQAAGRAGRRLIPVVVALVAMLSLARLMVHAGMIDVLAVAAAGGLGVGWPLLAPWVGVLGTFVTGSATASNILFTDFQQATAQKLGLPVVDMISAQGFGAAVGNIVCPHNIIAGGATVGLVGREGEVLRRTAVACAVYGILGGLLVWLLIALG